MIYKIKITYFKESGKYYDEAVIEIDDDLELGLSPNIPYMYAIVEKVETMQKEGKLPGLARGKWEHHILVTCEEGFPCLIPAKRQSKIEPATERSLRDINESLVSLSDRIAELLD